MTFEMLILTALAAFVILFIATLIFPELSEELSEFQSGAIEDVGEEIANETNKPSLEIADVINFISAINFVPLIILAIAIPVVISLIKIIPHTVENLNKKRSFEKSTESSRELRLGIKLKRNDDGYKAAQYLVIATDMLENIFKNEVETPNEDLKDIIMKMDETINMYLADREAFAMSMYEYEDTFKIMCETINRYVLSGQIEKTQFSRVINDLIEIPHEEIVKEEGSKWLYDKGKYERDVIRDIRTMREK